MSLRKERFIILAILLMFAYQTGCQGPFTEETHPVIWVNSYELTFSASEVGVNPSPQVLKIKNSGIQSLTYAISDDADWLTVSPTSGTTSGQFLEHLVSVDKTGLVSRSDPYPAKITITSLQACNSPQQVSISLKLSKEPPPEISVTPREVRFVASVGGSNPPAQTIRVKNSGQGTLSYTLGDDASWLAVSPASGTSTGSENVHNLTVNTAGLGAGTYTAVLNVVDANAVNSPQTVSVILEIGTSVPPTIAVSPNNLKFSGRVGGSNPASKNIMVWNSGQGTLDYTVTEGADWLDVNPEGGSSTGQQVSHTVSVNTAGLGAGTYSELITVSSPNAANSSQTVMATLEVGEVPTGNKISISCNPTSGRTGKIINVPITILGNTQEIKAFGLDVTYDTTMLNFVGVNRGSLTGSWAGVTGGQTGSGVRIGGFSGDPLLAIDVGSSGTIAILKFEVTCTSCTDGQRIQLCMGSFTDDIVGMTPAPSCTTFTYIK